MNTIFPSSKVVFMLLILLFCQFVAKAQQQRESVGLLRHVVTVNFKQGATETQIAAVDRSFKNLSVTLKMVKGYEWGVAINTKDTLNVSHVYVTTFASTIDEAAYGASPQHQAHIKLGADYIERVSATDFFIKQ